VARRGNVSVVNRNGEYQLVVGALRHPKAALLLGLEAKMAISQLDRISALGAKCNYSDSRRMIQFSGKAFFLNAKGEDSLRVYSFRGIERPIRFSLNETDVRAIKKAVLEE